MGLLSSIFARDTHSGLAVLPSGSFTIDRDGRMLASTLGGTFSNDIIQEIGTRVLQAFRLAHQAQMPLTEVTIQYSALKILARELRGGAIIFMSPQNFDASPRKP